ncbi:ABC transporter ATP-binding protein [Caldalkalibacillus mannanilyticus]|uniref:ABC transporter ATP-binding protein n=1 Tax=Caldalkalibacillus mannanilyticus TaxID=1418 RepID=UPI00046AB82D|nr:ABC transporter ATP-binding protein [Caldalkalibacillus mannanilyticus]
MNTILECSNLSKSYGKVQAVNHIDLVLEEETIYGLLGQNGAGKTTLLNMITGNLFSDYGDVKIFGKEIKSTIKSEELCYVKEKSFFFREARVRELLEIASVFHKNWDWKFAHELLKIFRLNPEKKYKQLSRGMESLVGIIIGLASRAPLTIFDEPVLGLDVIMREKFYTVLLEDYATHPRTILISTHLINEISKIIEKVYMIDAGRMILEGDMDSIRNQSYVISGMTEKVKMFIKDRNVIHLDVYHNMAIAAIFEKIDPKGKMEAARLELSIEGMSLQKLFTYVVTGRNESE